MFTEGQLVHQGEMLAQIDPRPYEAAVQQMEGNLRRDQALLADAKLDLKRYEGLVKEDSIAVQQLDTQRALVDQYEGTIESDPHAEITGFVVGSDFRSQRIGEQLLARAEAWARERNVKSVRLRSNVIRDRAHAFYLREGYEHYKSQKAFRKRFTSD